jgi:hypothetical protein
MKDSHCYLSLPEKHPVTELLDCRQEIPFLVVNDLTFEGSYLYHYRYSDEYVDTISSNLKVIKKINK